jgi:hypothetical protein
MVASGNPSRKIVCVKRGIAQITNEAAIIPNPVIASSGPVFRKRHPVRTKIAAHVEARGHLDLFIYKIPYMRQRMLFITGNKKDEQCERIPKGNYKSTLMIDICQFLMQEQYSFQKFSEGRYLGEP